MTIYQVKLKERRMVAQETMACFFEKPLNFTFKAGQWGDFTILNPTETDARGNVRGFTICSAPFEDIIMVTMRLRNSAFKRMLQKLPIGTILNFDAPGGSFTLHNKQTVPAVFLAGGIGVTPARSILLQAAKDKLSHKLYLFYSNHTPETAAFLEEMKQLESKNSNYKFIPTMTSMEKSKIEWKGHTGHIDQAMLSKYIPNLNELIYYISGPASMVRAMRKTLNDCGIDDDNIRTEEFSGY